MTAAAIGYARRRGIADALLALSVLLCVSLIVRPPSQGTFYPICPIHHYLHIDCPGCGATRALAALLHGKIAEAVRLNALFVLLLPFALMGAGQCYLRGIRQEEFRWPTVPAKVTYAALAIAAFFTIARNMFYPGG